MDFSVKTLKTLMCDGNETIASEPFKNGFILSRVLANFDHSDHTISLIITLITRKINLLKLFPLYSPEI